MSPEQFRRIMNELDALQERLTQLELCMNEIRKKVMNY